MSERKGTKALELWCKRLIRDCPDVLIENMTTSWRDGMAFCALVHHFRPDLIDMSKLKHENIYENNQLAFNVAEKYLGIPALLDPEDMVENDVPDRLSILTYLSQFYQRLGHTVTTKVSETESKTTKSASETAEPSAPIKFGKTGLDKCTACGLPVYLAQRLMVSHKLYHRRCFRCSKCSGHLNPKNYHVIEGSEFLCDSCKNDKTLMKYLNNNDHDQMGMLAFGDNLPDTKAHIVSTGDDVSPKQTPRPTSILDKINMFEKNTNTDQDINSKVANISLKDTLNTRCKDLSSTSGMRSETDSKQVPDIKNDSINNESSLHKNTDSINMENKMNESSLHKDISEKVYKSNIEKFNFLQTQLSGNAIDLNETENIEPLEEIKHKEKDCKMDIENDVIKQEVIKACSVDVIKEDRNITDDIRIAKIPPTFPIKVAKEPEEQSKIEQEIKISVPPRKKKQIASEKKTAGNTVVKSPKQYPDHLNPFSDGEEEEPNESAKKASTNPFGSSDEENDDLPLKELPLKVPGINTSTPVKRLIAVNPFWSDGEEPSSDEEDVTSKSSKSTYSSMATNMQNLPSGTPRRMKAKAPPPPVLTVTEVSRSHTTSMDDVSISSLSSYNSTFNSEQRTPTMRKKTLAPTPPDSLSTVSEGGSLDKGADTSDVRNASGSECGKKSKGPAPGLPLPERREVKLQMSPEELQVQLDLLETQQLGLERQGVLIERMIRDKCDEACTAPQEEVEDLVIQLCELVNEKNDLFRKQTELMYIRRQQRLEQEQADIEHEIRIIQSRPAVNRIDADKAREEQLVSRLVEIVRMRDELVQQLDAERRRERQEDLAIAASIASKRALRKCDASLKSADAATTHKKNKVKDKVKKQLKKAKHTLYSKKKDDSAERKEGKEAKSEKDRSN